jgi:hypothetical protein
MNALITDDESWVCGYDPETEAQSSQWKTPGYPRPKKTHQIWSKVKVMLTVFFNHEGIIHHEYAPDGQTVNKEYYIEVLCQLCDAVRCQIPASWQRGDRQLHHESAPAHSSHLFQNFLVKHQIPQVPQPLYSPDMALCYFFIPKGENAVEGE